MWGASHWTARFLVVVMLVSSFGPLTTACATLPGAMHCVRHAVSGRTPQTAMSCHHAQSQPAQSESSESSFHSTDTNCCQHHCCCGAVTSEWVQPASNVPCALRLMAKPARLAQSTVLHSNTIFGHDSARAPPLG